MKKTDVPHQNCIDETFALIGKDIIYRKQGRQASLFPDELHRGITDPIYQLLPISIPFLSFLLRK